MMRYLGVRPRWTLTGLALLIVGGVLEYRVITDVTSVSLWLAFIGPLTFGIGAGLLLAEWHNTVKIRRAGREWLAANPEPEDYDEIMAEEPDEPIVRYKRNGRGERRTRWERRMINRIPPEDNPYWPSYAARWVDKPENPTDGSGEMGDHD